MNSGNVRLFTPHQRQQEIIDQFVVGNEDKKWAVILTGRQFGKSLLAMNSMLYWLLETPGTKGVFVSLFTNQLDAVYYEMIEYAAPLIRSNNASTKRVLLKNGSEMVMRSAENISAMRGYTFDYGILDEAAFIKDEAMKVVRPTFAVHGKKIMIISTPWIKNWFYDYYQLAISDNPKYSEYIGFKAKSIDNPFFPQAELDAAMETLPMSAIRQEYYAEFVDNAGGVFTSFTDTCSVNEYHGAYPEPVYIGVDIAVAGRENSDYTCVAVMAQDGTVINIDRWRDGNTKSQIERLRACLNGYNIRSGYIEINQERGIWQEIAKDWTQIREWHTTRKNKPMMIQDLKVDIEQKDIALPTQRLDHLTFNEISDYTFENKANGYVAYSAPPGGHDDSVIALALANEARVPNRHRGNWFVMNLDQDDYVDEDDKDIGTIETIKLNQNGEIR